MTRRRGVLCVVREDSQEEVDRRETALACFASAHATHAIGSSLLRRT